jgi:hypothetical protein
MISHKNHDSIINCLGAEVKVGDLVCYIPNNNARLKVGRLKAVVEPYSSSNYKEALIEGVTVYRRFIYNPLGKSYYTDGKLMGYARYIAGNSIFPLSMLNLDSIPEETDKTTWDNGCPTKEKIAFLEARKNT